MKPVALALSLAIVLPAVPARAAPPASAEQSRRELERASGLELSREWAAYGKSDRTRSFAAYVERRYRVRRDIGRGFVIAGASLLVGATFFICFGLSSTGYGRMSYGIGGTAAALGGGLILPGAVLWGVYGPKAERIGDANDTIQYGAAPTHGRRRLHVRYAGPGLRFAF